METIKKHLDDLEQQLQVIQMKAARICDPDYFQNRNEIEKAIYYLQTLHRTPYDFTNRIIDLHSRYLNLCFKVYGFYPGDGNRFDAYGCYPGQGGDE